MATSKSKKSSGSTSSSRASSAPKPTSGVAVAAALLAKSAGPMKVVDLARAVVKSGRAAGLKGKTPEATIGAHVYVSARAGRTFVLVDRGLVDLIDRAPAKPKRSTAGRAKKVAAAA